MVDNPLKDLFTTKEAADYLGVKPETIKYHVHVSKRLKGMLLTPRMRLYTRTELDELAAELGRTPGQGPPNERRVGRPRKNTNSET